MSRRPIRERSITSVRKQITEAKHAFHLPGVHRGCTDSELTSARRDLALYVHPDVCNLKDATDLMARVNAAHHELTTRMDRYVLELNGRPCGFNKATETICSECHGAGVLA